MRQRNRFSILLLISCMLVMVSCTKKKFNQMDKPTRNDVTAEIVTNKGTIKVRLFPNVAPKAVENFTKLAEKKYYNGVIFHRVINNFMIQGGDPTGTGAGGQSIWGKPFKDEFSNKVHNFRGALSMANTGKNTNGSQFFIVQAPKISDDIEAYMKQNKFSEALINKYKKYGGTPWLDNKHTVFGQVYSGMDVVDKIAKLQADENGTSSEKITIKQIIISK
ncbi:peptidylprolyl isomerase [Clostridium oryzae]|uniref:Peptidyl-prolyl cis-trans isomerase n=1 Tax=Clostridium oryzae TaxID=1450648 RepID=A0A1V4ILN8_9CLOT|nr:peptidylprolyl isomerase [Clostridium oryzae]OPJ60846.1 putative peptidyl-prolyl cis-trans isomerase [Clostridium oryzae]